MLRWARENGCEWEVQEFSRYPDDIYPMEHLLAPGSDAGLCADAAMGGHIEVLKWLRAEGCPWDQWTCFFAVHQGHVEILRWARKNGCPWDAEDRYWAAEKLGYTDDLGNLVDWQGNSISSDEEDSDEDSDD